ncbi:MAG: hypothetical protein Ct9H300mP1_25530 [Planctomycetaceae bacterium]|nr:MAG: hypothetical protein Ct9H300mP1_25530 [Planctomycetaceae bacterium]
MDVRGPIPPDIGLVGKTAGKYTVFLGGNSLGTRLALNFSRISFPTPKSFPTLVPVLSYFGDDRLQEESFGDFCDRKGRDALWWRDSNRFVAGSDSRATFRDVVAALIDHAVLGPDQVSADLEEGCRLAWGLGTASVCCKPDWLRQSSELLDGRQCCRAP